MHPCFQQLLSLVRALSSVSTTWATDGPCHRRLCFPCSLSSAQWRPLSTDQLNSTTVLATVAQQALEAVIFKVHKVVWFCKLEMRSSHCTFTRFFPSIALFLVNGFAYSIKIKCKKEKKERNGLKS